MVPVGGGSLLSGVCVAVKNTKPDVKVFAAEPLNVDDCAKSFAANKRIVLSGLKVKCVEFVNSVMQKNRFITN